MATLRDTLKSLLGSAWHVNSDAVLAALTPAVDGTSEAGKVVVTDANNKVGGADLTKLVSGSAAGLKIARGQATTVAAADTIATGLATVIAVVASLEADPIDDPFMVTAQVGDQSAAPVAGSIIIKTWKNTGGTDPTPAAATTFSKKVNWIAIGT